MSGSSPDLVSSRTLMNNQQLMQLQQQRNSVQGGGGGGVGGSSSYMMKSTSSIGPQNYYINGAIGGVPNGGVGAMRHSHSYLPHGTYENLNCIDLAGSQSAVVSASHSNLYQYPQSSAGNGVNGEHMVAASSTSFRGEQSPQPQLNGNLSASSNNLNASQTNVSQSKQALMMSTQDSTATASPPLPPLPQPPPPPPASPLMPSESVGNNVSEPIYENLPLSCWSGGGGMTNVVDSAEKRRRKSGANQNQVTVTHTTSAAVVAGNGGNSAAALASIATTTTTTTDPSAEVPRSSSNSNDESSSEMRDRASSVQSAPAGGVRGSYRSTAEEDVQVTMVREKGEEEEEEEGKMKRPISKTFSNPVPNNVFQGSVSGATSTREMTSTVNNGLVVGRRSEKGSNGATVETSLLNRSQSANLLDSSHSSQFTDSGNISASTSIASIATGGQPAIVKEKRRGIWSILSRGKSSSSSSSSASFSGTGSAKQKSATLGKSNKNLSLLTRDEEDNLKRWSTGLPRMEPLSANMSKEQLVSGEGRKERI